MRLLVAGNDLSGDIGSSSSIHGGPAPLVVTDITQSAQSRLGGLRDGELVYDAYFDPATAHPVLSALPTADSIATVLVAPTLGGATAAINAKQLDYPGKRGND